MSVVEIGVMIQVVIAWAAFMAYVAVRQQIAKAEEHHTEQLHASLRPLVMIKSARVSHELGGASLRVEPENIGPGPATNIELRFWVRSLPAAAEHLRANALRELMDTEKENVDLDAPEMILRLGGLAASGSVVAWLRPDEGEIGAGPSNAKFILYLAKYADVFENEFPSKPRPEWQAGHHLLEPAAD